MPRLPITIEYSLLGFLFKQPRHGYDIYQHMLAEDGPGIVWRLKQSQVYALLSKLEEQGYIDSVLEPGEGYPPRKMLNLTPAGRDALMDWLISPVKQAHKMRQEFMAKLYFARQVDSVAASLIENQRKVCQTWLASVSGEAKTFDERHFEWLVYQFRVGQIKAMLDWLDVCEEMPDLPAG
jgi:PadR family transcriptional regulator AphA